MQSPQPDAEQGIAASIGRWIHRHKELPDKPVGFLGYQIIRSAIASVPYGIATAFVWDRFEQMTKAAQPKSPNLVKFLKSPVRDIAMIGVAFTFYRGTIKLVKYVREQLFDPKDSEQQTIKEVRELGHTIVDKVKEIAPAEVNSTPFGAIALGLGRRTSGLVDGYSQRAAEHVVAVNHPRTVHFSQNGKLGLFFTTPNGGSGFTAWRQDFHNRIISRKSMMLTDMMAWVIGFIPFFELSDRLFKDVQVRRGIWQGDDHAVARQPKVKNESEIESSRHIRRGKFPEVFEGDPNLKTLFLNRIIPTTIGISMYAVLKRASFQMWGNFTGKPTFMARALTEAAATTPLFVMNATQDIFEKMGKKSAPVNKIDETQHQGRLQNNAAMVSSAAL